MNPPSVGEVPPPPGMKLVAVTGVGLGDHLLHVNLFKRHSTPSSKPNGIQHAWGWRTVMTQRDVMGREVGGGFMFGNACTPVVDSCQCMAKPIQYCKVK